MSFSKEGSIKSTKTNKVLVYCIFIQYYVFIMNNVIKLNTIDPIVERYLLSVDKSSIKKTLAFEYFNNDVNELDRFINNQINNKVLTSDLIEPKAQMEFSF